MGGDRDGRSYRVAREFSTYRVVFLDLIFDE
jgi:hypothetical protein